MSCDKSSGPDWVFRDLLAWSSGWVWDLKGRAVW